MAGYVELHCHSYFSLLDGASSPEALVAQAARLGMPALALTDHDALYGAVRFSQAAAAHGIRPIFGAELTLEDGRHLTCLVEDETGWHNLCTLISLGRQNAPKGESALPYDALAEHTAGLLALSGCREGAVTQALLYDNVETALARGRQLQDWFGGRVWIELQRHLLPREEVLVARQMALARALGAEVAATNNVHYAAREGHRLQDILVCIRHNTALDKAAPLRRPGSEYYLKEARKLEVLFESCPEALRNTLAIAERCQFTPRYSIQDLPQFDLSPGQSAPGYLRQLCLDGARQRYGDCPLAVQQRLDYELRVITRAGLANYFLVVWDLIRFAAAQGILAQGRGSAANSLVAYLLGISPVDPLAHRLVFERFLSDERRVMPDIDIDFQADRREEVIQYVYETYGHDHAAMACTFVTYRQRSALRDVGKVLGLPAGELTALANDPDAVAAREDNPLYQQLQTLCEQIKGLPRHLGIHNGGMVVVGSSLARRVPVEPATMAGRSVVQWDKEGLEDAGLVKIDLLGLRMLSLIAEATELIAAQQGAPLALSRLTFDDPAVYALIGAADTIGVFQVESRAQSQLQPLFRPERFEDLIVAISIIRPGPIQGNMVHPYLRRRLGDEPVTYLHPRLKNALEETLGVILFQEQVLSVARDFAGFTGGQGEVLRRALGSKHATEALERLHDDFVQGARRQGVPHDIAEEVFDRLRAFGGYSFPKSHAAAFAVLVYRSAWLKVYHPAPFYAALLNHQPMGFWDPSVIVGDARRHDVPVLPVDLHRSEAKCALAPEGGVRLGFNYVKGFGEASIQRLLDAREVGAFPDLASFCRRTRLPKRLVENLILVGAFDGWTIPRRKLLWALSRLRYQADELALVVPEEAVALPELSGMERFVLERSLLGVSTEGHPLEFYRDALDRRGVVRSADLAGCRYGDTVRVAGLVAVHQSPPTAKGVHFITLEDEDGLLDLIVRPEVYRRFRRVIHLSPMLLATGTVQRRGQVLNVLAEYVAAL